LSQINFKKDFGERLHLEWGAMVARMSVALRWVEDRELFGLDVK
jgi:hypothetical protein